MKKRDLKKLALMGFTGGLLIASQSHVQADTTDSEPSFNPDIAPAQEQASENQLLSQLSKEGQQLYYSLDEEGQMLARLVAAQGQPQGGATELYLAHGCPGGCGGKGTWSRRESSCGASGGSCGASSSDQGYNNYNQGPSDYSYGQHGCQGPANYNQNQNQNPNTASSRDRQYRSQSNYQPNLRAENELTEQDLRSQLNPETKDLYDSLSPDGKKLALQMANQKCNHQNSCKGQGACKGEGHDCAGKNGCAGKGKGPFTDKNQAVKVAAMKEKRMTSLRTPY